MSPTRRYEIVFRYTDSSGHSPYGDEVLDDDLSKEDAEEYAHEYRMGSGPGCTYRVRRMKRKAGDQKST